ncbi:hypothetical protein [Leisingera aquaemixtae]|uniref:hypothetical protein n=1 Tax=Leisingera aquaemixtae TaxID=1396826 RepID=UPI0021A8B49B|nr:hypothetical protein [Leisingera aquaemixtae]UWQ47203.1 hypothetical protein K3719_07520 [Leisingera aquaemixtae]
MAVLSLLLVAKATLRQHEGPDFIAQNWIEEKSAAELNEGFNAASKAALSKAQARIGSLLDAAYKPVYAGIPEYADYHYSVWGEYAELTAAALGDVGMKLQETLFDGLDKRLEEVSRDLDVTFVQTFRDNLYESLGDGGDTGAVLGELTRVSLEDATNRTLVTAPVGSAVAIGTFTGIKVSTKAMAKKIAAKLAAKAAAKTGGKWAATGVGAGAAAAACSWTGPGAGLCAAVGGIGAWIVTDAGILMLDEFWTRNDFEADLRTLVEQQKAEHQAYFESAIVARVAAVTEETDQIVQHHDFTLRELYGDGSDEVCKIVDDLEIRYERLRQNLDARTPDAIEELRSLALAQRGNWSIDRLANEILENLERASDAKATRILITGNLPEEYRANRDVSALISFNGMELDPVRVEASKDLGFSINFDPNPNVKLDHPVSIGIAFEQHLRIKRNRYFSGYGEYDPVAVNAVTSGLEIPKSYAIKIARDEASRSIKTVGSKPEYGQTVLVTTRLRAEPIAQLEKTPQCD